MKAFIIYYIDNGMKMVQKDIYFCKELALNELDTVALDHVKQLEGQKQVAVAVQYGKSTSDIVLNKELKDGLYLRKEQDSVILYEKKDVVDTGIIFNGIKKDLVKIGSFGVIDIDFEDHLLPKKCECFAIKYSVGNTNDVKITNTKVIKSQLESKDEKEKRMRHTGLVGSLTNLFNGEDRKFGLKTINKKELKPLIIKSLEELKKKKKVD